MAIRYLNLRLPGSSCRVNRLSRLFPALCTIAIVDVELIAGGYINLAACCGRLSDWQQGKRSETGCRAFSWAGGYAGMV